jgi:predicted RNase H-like HicB family nuclease
MMKKEFFVVIERDEDGLYVGEVPHLRGCYAQGRTIDELMANMREVIALCLEDDEEARTAISPEFIGVQKVILDDTPARA